MEQFFVWLSDQSYILKASILVALAIIQNISFTLVSRSRNRDNKTYHVIAAIFSNGIYFLVFKVMLSNDFTIGLIIPYIIGTVSGSVIGMSTSMKIEKLIGASADNHLKPSPRSRRSREPYNLQKNGGFKKKRKR